MPNKAWLTTAAARRTFPRLQEPGYDMHLHTVADASWGIPLLWLALFRPGDLMVEDVTAGGRTYRDPAPVVETAVALRRLADSVVRLNEVFRGQGALEPHAGVLGEAVASRGRPFVTLEPEEIAWSGGDPNVFYAALERALAYFENPDTPGGRKDLLYVTPGVSEEDLPFPDPEALSGQEDYAVEDAEMLHFLLGRLLQRPLP